MLVVLKLHTDMFAGQPGKLFLGGMGLLFLIAIVSGVVLYWPFTRRLEFGTLRHDKSNRIRWLDWHNLLGVTTIVWACIVGGTGVINTWAEPMLDQWRASELASMVAPYAGRPLSSHVASLDKIVRQRHRRLRPAWKWPSLPFPERRSAARIILQPSCAATSR